MSKLFSFTARSADPAMELFLIDGRMQLVARGRRELATEQPPGIYTLKLRAGPSSNEELIILDRDLEHQVAPLLIPSAAPLDATSQSHEYHQHPARVESKRVHESLGKGSSIFVFARDWTPGGVPAIRRQHPAQGLALYDAAGELLVDFATKSVADLQAPDPWSACRVAVDPGFYRLGVKTALGECFEMMVPALARHHTSVFLLQRDRPGRVRGRQPDLALSSVQVSREPGFRPELEANRVLEIARLALADRRKVFDDTVGDLLRSDWERPLFGILGGHLLLLEERPDLNLLAEIVGRLRGILKTPHPDCEALALAAGAHTGYTFDTPPMLRASWRIIIEHSKRYPGLVTRGSWADSIATRVSNQEPWLIWGRAPSARQASTVERGYADFVRDHVKTAGVTIESLVADLDLPSTTIERLLDRGKRNRKA